MTRSDLLDRLTDLAPHDTVDPDGLAAAHRLLTARLAAPAEPAPARPRLTIARSRPRHVTRWALVGAAAATATVAAVVVPGLGDAPAFAGWTAVPATADPAALAADGAACLQRITPGATGAEADWPEFELAGASPVLTDRRGATAMTLVSSGGGDEVAACILGPQVTWVFALWPTAVSSMGGGEPTSDGWDMALSGGAVQAQDPPGAGQVSVPQWSVGGFGAPEPWGMVTGRAGDGVTGVSVALADGSSVTASVTDGYYAAWWPGATMPATVTPTLADGGAGASVAVGPGDDATVQVTTSENGNLEVVVGTPDPVPTAG